MARKRNTASKTEQHESLCQLGDRLAMRLNIPPTGLRYARIICHNGQQWTVTCGWERLVDGRWIPIDDREFPSHGSSIKK